MSKVDSQEHAAAAQTINHPIVKNARPEYPSADERINVLSLSAVNGGDRSNTGQGVDKVYRRFVHCLCEKCGQRSACRKEKKEFVGKSEMEQKIRTNRSKFD